MELDEKYYPATVKKNMAKKFCIPILFLISTKIECFATAEFSLPSFQFLFSTIA